jgi:hypothetical protein
MGLSERIPVYYREFLRRSVIDGNVNVQRLTRLGDVAKGTILIVQRPDGRYQHAAIVEARPTANFRHESSQKDQVKGRTAKPIRRSIDAQLKLIYMWVALTNIGSRYLEGIAPRSSECGGTENQQRNQSGQFALQHRMILLIRVSRNHLGFRMADGTGTFSCWVAGR